MTRTLIRFVALAFCTLSLAGCAALGALNSASEPRDAYELRAPADTPIARSTQSLQLIVEVPTASGAIDNDRILVRPNASQVQYLPDGRWTEAAPVMVQTALVETLLTTGAFRFVGRRPIGPLGDLSLVTHMSDFGVEVSQGTDGGTVVVTLIANLVRENDAAILSSRRFSRRIQIADTSTDTIISGFESVAGAIFADVARWVLGVRRIPIKN